MILPVHPANLSNFIKIPVIFPVFPQNFATPPPLPPQLEIYKGKIMGFLAKTREFPHDIELQCVKKYYHLPFAALPRKEELLQILKKIIERGESSDSPSGIWHKEELQLLTLFCLRLSFAKLVEIKAFDPGDWQTIGELLPYKSATQCKYKWFSLERVNLKKTPWSVEEDRVLKSILLYILWRIYCKIHKNTREKQRNQCKWKEIAEILFAKTGETLYRTGKHCRERWRNHLRPDLKKDPWSLEEDIALLAKVLEKNKRWAAIAREIAGRTENGVKNRFNSLLRKWSRVKKYAENVSENAKIRELHRFFVEKSQEECENFRKNGQNIRKNQGLLGKKHHFKEIIAENGHNLLRELTQSVKIEENPRKLVKTEEIPEEIARISKNTNNSQINPLTFLNLQGNFQANPSPTPRDLAFFLQIPVFLPNFSNQPLILYKF